jgi:hypothetical protein
LSFFRIYFVWPAYFRRVPMLLHALSSFDHIFDGMESCLMYAGMGIPPAPMRGRTEAHMPVPNQDLRMHA